MKTLILASAASLTLLGGGAVLAQNAGPSAEAPVVKAHFGQRGRKGRGGMMRQMLRLADADRDGALTQTELDAFVEAQTSGADANSDGSISLAEFETVWINVTRNRLVDAFQALDADGSGSITAEERSERFGRVVERLDRNDDGKLDRSDRRGRRDGRRGGRDR